MTTILEQTGWKRAFPKMLCQDIEVLLKINEYSYDLGNEDFLMYFRARTGIQLGKEEDWNLAKWLLTDPDAEEWLRSSKDYRYLNHGGKGTMVPFGETREVDVKINRIRKGQIQDCWELYEGERT